MSGNEMKNILVLGTRGIKIAEFVKLFEAYIQYPSYDEALKWEPNLSTDAEVTEITNSTVVIENRKFNFIYTPDLEDVCVSKQAILLHFLKKRTISAIIFLVKSTEQYDTYREYISCLFSKLKQFSDKNILHIFMCTDDHYNKNNETNIYKDLFQIERNEKNIFYFQENTFYYLYCRNWLQSVDFCRSIYTYLVGDEHINSLQDYCIQSVIPQASVLKLADDLFEILIQLYICEEGCKWNGECYYYLDIWTYIKNITICYNNNCTKWNKHKQDESIKIKVPKICHGPCTEFETDISKCTMFLYTRNKTCLQCHCKIDSHSRNYFGYTTSKSNHAFNEKYITIKFFTTLYIYKKQNQEKINFENIFNKFLDMHDTEHQRIFNNFKKEFDTEVKKIENPITVENILVGLKELYKVDVGRILSEFIEENFPKDVYLETVIEEQSELNKEKSSVNIEKKEYAFLKNEIAEIKQTLNQVLNLITNNSHQNANNLNSERNVQTSTGNINLNQNRRSMRRKRSKLEAEK